MPDSLKLLQHQLGSISLDDIEEEDMSDAERKEYCSTISAVFPRLEKDIKRFLYSQLMFMSNNAQNWDQVIFGRGTFNGMDILLNHWRQAHTEHQDQIREVNSPKFDKSNPIGEMVE